MFAKVINGLQNSPLAGKELNPPRKNIISQYWQLGSIKVAVCRKVDHLVYLETDTQRQPKENTGAISKRYW